MSPTASRWPTRFESNGRTTQVEDCVTDWRHGPSLGVDESLEFDPEDYDSDDSQDYDRPVNVKTSFPHIPRTPLIDSCTNDWKTSPSYRSTYSSPERDEDDIVSFCIAALKAPKLRRYLLIYLILFTAVYYSWAGILQPRWQEHQELTSALSEGLKPNKGGWFGSNVRPHFADMIQLKTLDEGLLPGYRKDKDSDEHKRLVIVGDVHGCKDELVHLLDKASFRRRTDHLIFTGDILSKGPDSLGVVDLARKLGASCVRGNHEDRILLVHRDLNANFFPEKESNSVPRKQDDSHLAIARALSPAQVEWLQACPVILRVGDIKGMGEVVVVHAGLVPGVELEKQDPASVMNMRTIDLETHVPSKAHEGMPWTKLWNKHQNMLSKSPASDDEHTMKAPKYHTTVVYGHDARRGLQIAQYTKGLDSSCVKGGRLTALVISDGGKQEIYQVSCSDHQSATSQSVDLANALKHVKLTSDGENGKGAT